MVMKIKARTIVCLLVVLVAIAGLSIMGCGTDDEEEVLYLTIGGSAPGGGSYIHGGGLASMIDKYVDGVYATVEATTGAIENCRLIETGEAPLGFILSNVIANAYDGKPPFDKPVEKVAIMMMGQVSAVHIVARADSPIKSIAEIADYRLATGAPGSACAVDCGPAILGAYGLTYDDLDTVFLTPAEVASAMADRSIDVGFILAGHPVAAVTEMFVSHDMKLISLEEDIVDQIIKDNPYFVKQIIPAGTYPGQDEDAFCVALVVILGVSLDVPEDVVYNILTEVHARQDEWIEIHPQTAYYTPENMALLYEGIGPLHPGAERYLKEHGLLD